MEGQREQLTVPRFEALKGVGKLFGADHSGLPGRRQPFARGREGRPFQGTEGLGRRIRAPALGAGAGERLDRAPLGGVLYQGRQAPQAGLLPLGAHDPIDRGPAV